MNKTDGSRADGINLQSGLVCYLIDTDTRFPSNMNYSGPRWNYEVLGGTYGTKTDAAVKVDDDILITNQISILVTEIADHKLTFRITGISGEHVHTGGEATCSAKAICAVCHQEYGENNPENHKNTELRGAKEAAVFRSNAALEDFVRVELDGKAYSGNCVYHWYGEDRFYCNK